MYDGSYVFELSSISGFGANITANTYENGLGIIGFDGDVTTIPDSAFYDYNYRISSISLPESVKSIGNSAFEQTNISNFLFPNSVENIGYRALAGCSMLTSVTFGENLKTLDGTNFFERAGVTDVQWNSINCQDFTDEITPFFYDDRYGFDIRSQIKTFSFGVKVTHIPSYLCSGMTNLETITVNATVPPTVGTNALSELSSLSTIYVPSASVETYKTTSGWSTYKDKIQAIVEPSVPKTKSFLDLFGLSTFWKKIKSYFVSSTSDDSYLKITSGDTKSIDIDSDKLAKGTSEDAGTKLATDGYIDDLISENASEALTKEEIDNLK